MAYSLTNQQQHIIDQSPFLLFASGSESLGADMSPRGDSQGFVQQETNGCLLLPDRIGNNRLDSLSNILENPQVSLVFFIPQKNAVLITKGEAQIVIDPVLLKRFIVKGKPPRSVIRIALKDAYEETINHEFWLPVDGSADRIPRLGDILSDQISGVSKEEANTFVNESYRKRLY